MALTHHVTRREVIVALVAFAIFAALYTARGAWPGNVLLPLDLKADFAAWKPDPTVRIPVSNRLLSDVVLHFVPWDLEARRLMREGQLPFVNRFGGESGAPLLANPQTGLLSPFTWPRLLFGQRGWAFSVFLKLLVAALSMYWLARETGQQQREALVCAIVFSGSGFVILWALHPHSSVLVFLPALLASIVRMLRVRTPWSVLFVVSFAFLATAGGHPETLILTVLAIAVFLFISDLFARRTLLRACAPAAAGFLMMGVVLVPFALIVGQSDAAVMRASAPSRGFRFVAIPGLILPGFLGTPLKGELDLTGAVPDGENIHLRSGGFVGLVALLLLVLSFRQLDPHLRRGLILGFIALILSWRPPLVEPIFRHIPLLAWTTVEYAAAVFVLFAALSVGAALSTLAAGARWVKAGILLLAVGLAMLVAGILPSIPLFRPALVTVSRHGVETLRARGLLRHPADVYERRLSGYLEAGRWTALRRVAVPGFFWCVGAVGLISRRSRWVLLASAVCGDLIAFGLGYFPVMELARAPATPPALVEMSRLDPARAWTLASPSEVYPANLGTEDRVRQIDSYDVLESRSMMERLRGAGFSAPGSFPDAPSAAQQALLRQLGVRFFLSRVQPPGTTLVAGLSPPAAGLYDFGPARPTALPLNVAPKGLVAGMIVSVAGAALALFLMWRARSRNNSGL